MQNRCQCSSLGQEQTPSYKPIREMNPQEARSWLESLRTRLIAKSQRERAYLDRRAARGLHTLTDDAYEQDQRLEHELLMLIETLLQESAELEGVEP